MRCIGLAPPTALLIPTSLMGCTRNLKLGQRGGKSQGPEGNEIGVWALWAKCQTHSFATIIRSVYHKHAT